MYNENLANQILRKLYELFPTPTSSEDLRESQVQGFKNESKENWLDAIDAMMKLGWISGKAMHDSRRLITAANLLITAQGREELNRRDRPDALNSEDGSGSNLIFLSHAARDQELAIVLKATIESAIRGSDVFVSSDTEDLRPGDDWVDTILVNLQRARLLVILATGRSLGRTWVWYESGAAWSRRIRMVPCCVGEIRKNNLPAPFSSRQALNIDEQQDFRYLLKEIGETLKLSAEIPDLRSIVNRMKDLDHAAQSSETETLSNEQKQARLEAMNVSAVITQANRTWIDLALKNESSEEVTLSHIQLFGPERVALAEQYSLATEPEDKRKIKPNDRLPVQMRLETDPTARLANIIAGGSPWPRSVQATITIEVGCIALGRFKRCESNRRVQLEPLDHQMRDLGL